MAMAAMMIMGVGWAQAGTLAVSSATYAVEAVGPTTVIHLDPTGAGIQYTMAVNRLGVGVLTPQDFVVRYEMPAGTRFQTINDPVCSILPVVPPNHSDGVVVNLRTGGLGSNFVEYDITLNGEVNIPKGAIISWIGPTITYNGPINHGDQLFLEVELRDKNSHAMIDSTPIARPVVSFANASDFWNSTAFKVGVKTDSDTSVDPNYVVPLAGFVPQNDDRALVAAATVQVINTTPGVLNPTPTAPGPPPTFVDYVLVKNDKVTITIKDPTNFSGLKTDGLWWDLDDSGTRGTTETFKVSKDKATLTLFGNNLGFGKDHKLYYEVDGNTMLMGRTLSISGAVNASVGADHDFTGNENWWLWNSASGVVLQAPLFQVPPGWLSRFVLTNACPNNASYNTIFLSESGVTVTPGADASGTVSGNSTLVLDTANVLSVSGRSRGTAIFTVDAPSVCIQGLYQVVNPSGDAISNHVMVRPGTN